MQKVKILAVKTCSAVIELKGAEQLRVQIVRPSGKPRDPAADVRFYMVGKVSLEGEVSLLNVSLTRDIGRSLRIC